MKKKVILRRIFHREKNRIGLFFEYDEKIKSAIKAVPGSLFSGTLKCYYVDDTEEMLKHVMGVLRDVAEVDISELALPSERARFQSGEREVPVVPLAKREEAERQESGEEEALEGFIPDEEELRYAPGRSRFGPVEFTIREKEGKLVVKFVGRYDQSWIDEMRTYGRLRYLRTNREWLLDWSKIACDSLADFFTSRGVEVTVRRTAVSAEVAGNRKELGDEIRSRSLGEKARRGLKLMEDYLGDNRYSGKTTKSYLPLLELFFKYYDTKDPDEITVEEISLFIHNFVVGLGYSESYQNQVVSAIKTYYEISGSGRVNPVLIDRPRRGRALPKVFSKEEVKTILNSARNVKHKLLLWLIYSCGLRRSEVVNVRLEDLDRGRKVLFIKEGKGKVDRIVPVSDKVWEKIDGYVDSYRPAEFLFEGPGGGRYSVESVYNVFKQALKRAGIHRDVGVHSLRHSYATHLHESGLDIRYIQELLGHKSTKTTEIYTHVSRRNLVAIRSPIDDLDLK
ncbi:MAG: tyrosine-type recombinase/integrase [Bacteroidales bacterium]